MSDRTVYNSYRGYTSQIIILEQFIALTMSCCYHGYRPADRTGEDLDLIFARLKDLKAFEKFHPLLLQQICYYSYYEDLEQGVICTSDHTGVFIYSSR